MSRTLQADRVEDGAARSVLGKTKISPAAILRKAGLPVSGRLTFSMLREFADFPGRPRVTGEMIGPPATLLGCHESKFEYTGLYSGWVEAFRGSPFPVGRRAMIAKGLVWGYMVLRDGNPPESPHVAVGLTERLFLLPLASWVRELGWSEDADSAIDEE